ncbi:MAG: ASPIC/UnbV domain-containing protein [Fuerstiella sp.]|nr:redoxin domain-containing protein [Fuerstiella sp.]
MSAVSGLDFLDDGRCVAPVDWDLDGDLDLWFANRTGPTLRFVRNSGTASHHFLALRLVGQSCNRDAIGARVEVTTSQGRLIRTLHAGDGYLAQASKWIHIGLGTETAIEHVTVQWPGGKVEEFTNCTADARFRLLQGSGVAAEWTPPQRSVALAPSRLETVKSGRARRIVLRDRVPVPVLDFTSFDGESISVPADFQRPVLINFWATWCAPCLGELKEFAQAEALFQADKFDIVALNVEVTDEDSEAAQARAELFIRRKVQFPFRSGMADTQLLEKIDALQEILISLREESVQLPSSFLIDQFGRLAVIYSGPVKVAQLRADVASLYEESTSDESFERAGLPFPGRWFNAAVLTDSVLIELVSELHRRDLNGDALRLGGLAADLMSRRGAAKEQRTRLATLFFETGEASLRREQYQTAVRYLGEVVRLQPDWAEAHANLGNAFRLLHRRKLAADHLVRAVQLKPELLQAHMTLGLLYLDENKLQAAAQHFQATVQIQPEFSDGCHYLGLALLRMGYRQQGVSQLRKAVLIDSDNAAAKKDLNLAVMGQVP